jgi:hypothetical protein
MEWYENLEKVKQDYINWGIEKSSGIPYAGDITAVIKDSAEKLFTEGWHERLDPFGKGSLLIEIECFRKYQREVIKISIKVAKVIVYDDHEDWQTIQTEITGNWRHGDENTGVFKRLSDGKFFRIDWRDSVKDSCGFEDCNYGDFEATEVFPTTKTITVYE